MNNPTCRARVQVTLEIDAGSAWGGDCALQQVYDQAGREVIQRLHNALRPTEVRIIGEPKVTTVITESL